MPAIGPISLRDGIYMPVTTTNTTTYNGGPESFRTKDWNPLFNPITFTKSGSNISISADDICMELSPITTNTIYRLSGITVYKSDNSTILVNGYQSNSSSTDPIYKINTTSIDSTSISAGYVYITASAKKIENGVETGTETYNFTVYFNTNDTISGLFDLNIEYNNTLDFSVVSKNSLAAGFGKAINSYTTDITQTINVSTFTSGAQVAASNKTVSLSDLQTIILKNINQTGANEIVSFSIVGYSSAVGSSASISSAVTTISCNIIFLSEEVLSISSIIPEELVYNEITDLFVLLDGTYSNVDKFSITSTDNKIVGSDITFGTKYTFSEHILISAGGPTLYFKCKQTVKENGTGNLRLTLYDSSNLVLQRLIFGMTLTYFPKNVLTSIKTDLFKRVPDLSKGNNNIKGLTTYMNPNSCGLQKTQVWPPIYDLNISKTLDSVGNNGNTNIIYYYRNIKIELIYNTYYINDIDTMSFFQAIGISSNFSSDNKQYFMHFLRNAIPLKAKLTQTNVSPYNQSLASGTQIYTDLYLKVKFKNCYIKQCDYDDSYLTLKEDFFVIYKIPAGTSFSTSGVTVDLVPEKYLLSNENLYRINGVINPNSFYIINSNLTAYNNLVYDIMNCSDAIQGDDFVWYGDDGIENNNEWLYEDDYDHLCTIGSDITNRLIPYIDGIVESTGGSFALNDENYLFHVFTDPDIYPIWTLENNMKNIFLTYNPAYDDLIKYDEPYIYTNQHFIFWYIIDPICKQYQTWESDYINSTAYYIASGIRTESNVGGMGSSYKNHPINHGAYGPNDSGTDATSGNIYSSGGTGTTGFIIYNLMLNDSGIPLSNAQITSVYLYIYGRNENSNTTSSETYVCLYDINNNAEISSSKLSFSSTSNSKTYTYITSPYSTVNNFINYIKVKFSFGYNGGYLSRFTVVVNYKYKNTYSNDVKPIICNISSISKYNGPEINYGNSYIYLRDKAIQYISSSNSFPNTNKNTVSYFYTTSYNVSSFVGNMNCSIHTNGTSADKLYISYTTSGQNFHIPNNGYTFSSTNSNISPSTFGYYFCGYITSANSYIWETSSIKNYTGKFLADWNSNSYISKFRLPQGLKIGSWQTYRYPIEWTASFSNTDNVNYVDIYRTSSDQTKLVAIFISTNTSSIFNVYAQGSGDVENMNNNYTINSSNTSESRYYTLTGTHGNTPTYDTLLSNSLCIPSSCRTFYESSGYVRIYLNQTLLNNILNESITVRARLYDANWITGTSANGLRWSITNSPSTTTKNYTTTTKYKSSETLYIYSCWCNNINSYGQTMYYSMKRDVVTLYWQNNPTKWTYKVEYDKL